MKARFRRDLFASVSKEELFSRSGLVGSSLGQRLDQLINNPHYQKSGGEMGNLYALRGRYNGYLGNHRQQAMDFNESYRRKKNHYLALAESEVWAALGEYEKALADYRKALSLDERMAEGPGWLWRFMRNIDEKPPTIKDRADYLEAELKKPPGERLLKVPEIDSEQRMHKKSY